MYIYVTEQDVKRMKVVINDNLIHKTLKDALEFDKSLLVEEIHYFKKKKGYRGWFLGEKTSHYRYNVFHESPAHDGSAYQAVYQSSACGGREEVLNYLFGIINGGRAVYRSISEQHKNQ